MARSAKDIFGILVRENELELLAFVRSCIRHAADCEEIVQETVLAAWENLDRFDQDRPGAGSDQFPSRDRVREPVVAERGRRL